MHVILNPYFWKLKRLPCMVLEIDRITDLPDTPLDAIYKL